MHVRNWSKRKTMPAESARLAVQSGGGYTGVPAYVQVEVTSHRGSMTLTMAPDEAADLAHNLMRLAESFDGAPCGRAILTMPAD